MATQPAPMPTPTTGAPSSSTAPGAGTTNNAPATLSKLLSMPSAASATAPPLHNSNHGYPTTDHVDPKAAVVGLKPNSVASTCASVTISQNHAASVVDAVASQHYHNTPLVNGPTPSGQPPPQQQSWYNVQYNTATHSGATTSTTTPSSSGESGVVVMPTSTQSVVVDAQQPGVYRYPPPSASTNGPLPAATQSTSSVPPQPTSALQQQQQQQSTAPPQHRPSTTTTAPTTVASTSVPTTSTATAQQPVTSSAESMANGDPSLHRSIVHPQISSLQEQQQRGSAVSPGAASTSPGSSGVPATDAAQSSMPVSTAVAPQTHVTTTVPSKPPVVTPSSAHQQQPTAAMVPGGAAAPPPPYSQAPMGYPGAAQQQPQQTGEAQAQVLPPVAQQMPHHPGYPPMGQQHPAQQQQQPMPPQYAVAPGQPPQAAQPYGAQRHPGPPPPQYPTTSTAPQQQQQQQQPHFVQQQPQQGPYPHPAYAQQQQQQPPPQAGMPPHHYQMPATQSQPIRHGRPPSTAMNGPSMGAKQNGKDTSLPSTPGAQSPSDSLDHSLSSPSQWPQQPRGRPPSLPRTPSRGVGSSAPPTASKESAASIVERLTGTAYGMEPQLYQQRRAFYENLVRFNESKGTPITSQPTVSKQMVDLYRLYWAVRERGGFEAVTKAKSWKDICPLVNTEMAVSSAAGYQLRKHYLAVLLPFECAETGQNLGELMEFSEKQKKNKRRPRAKKGEQAGGAGGPDTPDKASATATTPPAHMGDPAAAQYDGQMAPREWQQAAMYGGHPGMVPPRGHWMPQQGGAYPPNQPTPPAFGAPPRHPNAGMVVRDPFDDRASQQPQTSSAYNTAAGAAPPNVSVNGPASTEDSAASYYHRHGQNAPPSGPWHGRVPPAGYPGRHAPGTAAPGKPVTAWPPHRDARHAHQQQFARRVEPTPIVFPPGCVESTTISSRKRRKLRRADLGGKVDAWRLIMALKSGLHSESHWALNLLNILLYDDSAVLYFNLRSLPGLLEVLVEHLRRCLIELFPEERFDELEIPDEIVNVCDRQTLGDHKNKEDTDNDDADLNRLLSARKEDMITDIEPSVKRNKQQQAPINGLLNYTRVSRTGRTIHTDTHATTIGDRLRRRLINDDRSVADQSIPNQDLVDNECVLSECWSKGGGLSSAHLGTKLDDVVNDRRILAFHVQGETGQAHDGTDESGTSPQHKTEIKTEHTADETDTEEQTFYYHSMSTTERACLHNDECRQLPPCALLDEPDNLTTQIRRCLAVSNAIRGLAFVPNNDTPMSKLPSLLQLIGRLILLKHQHVQTDPTAKLLRRVFPVTNQTSTCMDNAEISRLTALQRCADQLREDALVVMCQLSCVLDFYAHDASVTYSCLDALLHWCICAAPCARDPLAPGVCSPLMYSLEALCKLSVNERNVDMLLATGPWPRIERFLEVLGNLLSMAEDVPTREFAIVLTNALCVASPAACASVAFDTPAIHHLVAFIEVHDSSMHQVVSKHGMQALRENPELIGTSVGMLRRAASVLQCLSRLPVCRPRFVKHQQRLLQFTMSTLMDSRVAAIIADTLYELHKELTQLNQDEAEEEEEENEKRKKQNENVTDALVCNNADGVGVDTEDNGHTTTTTSGNASKLEPMDTNTNDTVVENSNGSSNS